MGQYLEDISRDGGVEFGGCGGTVEGWMGSGEECAGEEAEEERKGYVEKKNR